MTVVAGVGTWALVCYSRAVLLPRSHVLLSPPHLLSATCALSPRLSPSHTNLSATLSLARSLSLSLFLSLSLTYTHTHRYGGGGAAGAGRHRLDRRDYLRHHPRNDAAQRPGLPPPRPLPPPTRVLLSLSLSLSLSQWSGDSLSLSLSPQHHSRTES